MLAERSVNMKTFKIIFFALFSLIFTCKITADDLNKSLLFKLYQEEKMSYELMGEFYNNWQLEVFNSVKERDEKHVWCMDKVIMKYGYENNNSAAGNLFNDKKIQAFYDEMSVKGSISDLSALEAAAYIKERSIYELRERIVTQSDPYIVKVIFLMEQASQKQFRALVESIKLSGSDYTPVYLTEDEYNNIVAPVNSRNAAGN